MNKPSSVDFLGENENWTMKNYFFDKHVLFIFSYDKKGINELHMWMYSQYQN